MQARRTRRVSLLVLAAAIALGRAAGAQETAGTVAALQGRADAQHAGQQAWIALAAGKDVLVGDRLRTGDAARLKLLLRDDSVITLGPKSELVLDQQVVRPQGGTSSFSALVGAVRAVVTERYGTKGSSFEVKTPTAVAGVRGTGFVALVDPGGERTRVIGVYDTTYVRSVTDAAGRHEVAVGPQQMTEVLAGGLPSKPKTLAPGELDALVSDAGLEPSGPGAEAGAGEQPAGTDEVPAQGSGDAGDPAIPRPPGNPWIDRPDDAVDQPVDRLRGPRLPPPPPPQR